MNYPNLKEEKRLWKKGCLKIAGLDEAGRGPLAGPVVAAAVMLKNNTAKKLFTNLDAKIIHRKKREGD